MSKSEGLLAHLKKLFENAGINDIPECDDDYMKTLRDGVNEAVLGVSAKIQDRLNFLTAHQLETNAVESFDWNIGYNHGLNKAIDELRKLKALLGAKEKGK